MINSGPLCGLELRIRRCESNLSESENMGGIRDPGCRKPVLMIYSQLVNMLRVIQSQKGEFSRPETATKRVPQRKSPTRKGQVLESRNIITNPSQLPTRKPLPLQPSQLLVVQRKPSHGSPVLQRVLIRSLKKNRIDVVIITYVISVVRIGIRPETVLIRSLWKNPRKRRLSKRSL